MTRRYTKAEIVEYLRSQPEAERRAFVLAAWNHFVKNLETVGQEPNDRLAWIEGFARGVSPNDQVTREKYSHLLYAFTVIHLKGWGAPGVRPDIHEVVEPDEVPMIHAAVRDVFDQLHAARPDDEGLFYARLPVAVGDEIVWRPGEGVTVVTRGQGSLHQVLAALAHLLVSIGPRLRVCETHTCRRLFGLRRKGQKHCTIECGRNERVRKWRAKHGDEHSENRHRQYSRKVKKQLHAGVRVSRRGRKQE